MQPYNPSRLNTAKSAIRPKSKGRKGKTRTANKPSTKRLVPVGNQAPVTFGGPPLGGKANSKANLPRKQTVKNKAPKKRVPILGNTGTMGMMGF